MANQTRQLVRLLEAEGIAVSVIRTNAPYRPAWIGSLRGVRSVFRLIPYMAELFAAAGHVDVVHVMANSGWAWHLFAAPAVWMARLRGTPVVVNYRGGLAAEFLDRRPRAVRRTLQVAGCLVVPSRFLQEVFASHGMAASIIPNVVDVETFRPASCRRSVSPDALHIVVARNLEHLYGNDTAIRAFAILRRDFPRARLSIAGGGPDLGSLRNLAGELGVEECVRFTGFLDTEQMVALYQQADVVLNPSRADNTPNSILEAVACGVPVVSTDVGGVPYLVEHARTAWLVPAGAPGLLVEGIVSLIRDEGLRARLVENGLRLARDCSWPVVGHQWIGLYRQLAERAARRHGVTDVAR